MSPPPPAVAFEALLAHAAKGNALWKPRANSGSVGDCGYFMDGSFIKLFSVFGPPLGLPMLQLDSGDVQRHNLPNTSVLQSSSKSKIMLARGVPVGPPPHTVTGSFELSPEEPACAFLAFGGHSRVVDTGPAKKLAQYLAENRRKIFERFRADAPGLEEDAVVILHETTKAGAWLGGVAYAEGGAVSGTFTLDGEGAKVTLPRPRDPSALKNPARVRWEFTYGRSDGPTPTCCVVAKAIVARRRSASSRSSTRSRSSTWSVASPQSGSGWGAGGGGSRASTSTTASSARSRSSTWSKGSGRRLSVRALAEWNRLHPRTPMTEDDLEIRSPLSPDDPAWHQHHHNTAPPTIAEHEGEGEGEGDDRSLLERLLDNILREYPSIDVAVGDWSCISDYEERHSKTPSADIVPAFKALHTWLTPDGVNAAYLSHIPPQATSFQFIDLRAYTSGMRPTTTLSSSSSPLPMSRTASASSTASLPGTASPQRRPPPSRKPSVDIGPGTGTGSAASSRRPSDASIGPRSISHSRGSSVHAHVGAPVPTDAGRRLRAGSVLVAMSLPAPAPAPRPLVVRNP